MNSVRLWLAVGAAVAIAAVATAVAVKNRDASIPVPKPGLYEVHKASNIIIFIVQDLSKTPIAEQKRLSDEALARPTPAFTICITPGPSDVLHRMVGPKPGCRRVDVPSGPNSYVSDMSCKGKPPIHVDFRMATPEHLSLTLSEPKAKAAITMKLQYDFRWLSADCGALAKTKPMPTNPQQHQAAGFPL